MDEHGFLAKLLRGDVPEAPITKLLGWQFLSYDPTARTLKVQMLARSEFLNPAGAVHGGMLAAMLDETLAPAVAATLGPGEFAPTLEIKVSFISAAKPGPVFGVATITSKGRSICFAEGKLYDEGDRLLATASATFSIRRNS